MMTSDNRLTGAYLAIQFKNTLAFVVIIAVLLVRPEGAVKVTHVARGRYCHNCGRASPYVQILREDRCLRCRQFLHACGNCVYFDGTSCLLERPEAHGVHPGHNCAYFQFRETKAPKQKTSAGAGSAM